MANAPRPASAVAKPNQAGWHTFPSGRTAWIDKFGRPDDIITLTRPAAKYQTADEEEITYERLMDRTKNERRKELGDKQLNAIINSTGVDWSRHKCKRRSQAELLLKLGTEDVVRKRTDQEERTKRAIRRIEAGRLVRVTTLGREDKDRMLQAPSSPRHRLRREVSAPTRLALMGDAALTMQPEDWAAKLKAQRLAPKAAIWSMKDPGYGAEGPSGDSLLINDHMRKEGIGLRKPKPLVRKGSAGSNQANVPPRSEAEGGSELIKELEPAAPVAQPNLPELVSMPMVEEPPRVLETKPVPQEGFPNAEAEGNVMVFDEAEASVERALRRLAPSPGPKPGSMNVASSVKRSRWCTQCDDFYNGAKDAPDASMCTKKAGKQKACYANNAGCPSDMKPYTCNPSVAGENGPAAGVCPATTVGAYNGLKTEVSALMTELLALKQTEQDLTLQLITIAENHATCACGPVDQLKSFML